MKLSVDTNSIGSSISKIDKYIKEYSDNSYNILYELSKIDNYWKGLDAATFIDKINDEKVNTSNILKALTDITNFYKSIHSYYDKFK